MTDRAVLYLQKVSAVGPEQGLLVGDDRSAGWPGEPADESSPRVLQTVSFCKALKILQWPRQTVNLLKSRPRKIMLPVANAMNLLDYKYAHTCFSFLISHTFAVKHKPNEFDNIWQNFKNGPAHTDK